MVTTVYRVTYNGPTNYRGSRFRVTPLRNVGKPRTVGYDHSASDARVQALRVALGYADDGSWSDARGRAARITYGGEDTRHTYYVVTTDD